MITLCLLTLVTLFSSEELMIGEARVGTAPRYPRGALCSDKVLSLFFS